jgi:hypothetical protein
VIGRVTGPTIAPSLVTDLVQAVDFFRVDLLGFSVSLSPQLMALQETITAVRISKRMAQIKILVGGGAIANSGDLPQQLGADAYVATAADIVRAGNRLVGLVTDE